MAEESFDEILVRLETGKWNFLYFIGIGLCGFLTAPNVLGGAFLTPHVSHTCRPPFPLPQTDQPYTQPKLIQVSECDFTINVSHSTLQNLTSKVSSENFTKVKHECQQWNFDSSIFYNTITTEFNLVCDDSYWRATYQTVYMIGNFFGSPINGVLSDRLGRRLMLTIGCGVFIISSILTAWLPTFSSLLVFRFILGLMHPAVLQTGYIMCMEICQPKYRSIVGIMISLPWALGTIWWGMLGYLIRDWRWLQQASSFPGLIILVFLCFFDESPRWLIIKGRHEEALLVLDKAAKWNGTSLPPPDKLLDTMAHIQRVANAGGRAKVISKETSKYDRIKSTIMSITLLFRTPTIRRRTLLMYIDFLVASTVFYGLSLNAMNFSADPFTYMSLTGLVEVPAYTLTAPIVAKLGRRAPVSCCYFVCAATILSLAFTPNAPAWLVIMLAMAGKMSISAAYQIIYLISSEIFPTEVRLQGLGSANLVARIGATSSPFVTDLLGPRIRWAPSLLFGCLSLVASVASLALPETLLRALPETVAQLEEEEREGAAKRVIDVDDNEVDKPMIP